MIVLIYAVKIYNMKCIKTLSILVSSYQDRLIINETLGSNVDTYPSIFKLPPNQLRQFLVSPYKQLCYDIDNSLGSRRLFCIHYSLAILKL